MDWKPNKLIAILLGFLFQPLGMLYIARVKLALVYFVVGLVTGAADLWLEVREIEWIQYFSLGFIPMITCAVHIHLILRRYDALSNRPWFSHWYGLISFPIMLVVIIFSFRSFLYEPFRIVATSMSPSLNPGDIIIVSKCGYGNYGTYGFSLVKVPMEKQLKRGDLVVFELPKDPAASYVKRIIGLPGDTVEYRKGFLAINDIEATRNHEGTEEYYEVYREHLGKINYVIKTMPKRSPVNGHVSVPEGHVFVLGDNRDNSNDSRYWGFVPLENIVGKMVYVF